MKKVILASCIALSIACNAAHVPIDAAYIASVMGGIKVRIATEVNGAGGVEAYIAKMITDITANLAKERTNLPGKLASLAKIDDVYQNMVAEIQSLAGIDQLALFATTNINKATAVQRSQMVSLFADYSDIIGQYVAALTTTGAQALAQAEDIDQQQFIQNNIDGLRATWSKAQKDVAVFKDLVQQLDSQATVTQPIVKKTKQQMLQERKQKALKKAKEQLAKAKKAKNKKAIKRWQGVIKRLTAQPKKQVKKPAGKKAAIANKKSVLVKK